MIREIEINGKKEKFSFGLGYLGDMLFKLNMGFIEFGKVSDENPFKYTPIKMMHSFNYANNSEITEKDMVEMLESDGGMFSSAIEQFNICWMESMTKNVPISDNQDKKKVKK